METDTVFIVRSQVPQLDGVPALDNVRRTKRDNLVLEALRADCDWSVINHKISDGKSLRIDEERFVVVSERPLQVEVYHSVSKIVIAFLKRKLEVIFDFLDNRFAPFSLFKGQYNSLFKFLVNDSSVT